MVDPAVDPPVAVEKDDPDTGDEPKVEASGEAAESSGNIVKSTSWWGVSGLTSLISSPHMLEESLNSVANQVVQATSGASQMVKSKSMEVMKAVTTDLSEVKENLGQYSQYTDNIKKAGGVLKTTLTDLDEATDEMAEVAIQGVTAGASSFWKVASGYASQMFVEDDLQATPVLVGSNSEPIILDRLQAQLHALSSDSDTYTQDPHLSDCSSEDWTAYLAGIDLDRRQGEISDLMINNSAVRKQYSSLVPSSVQHKLFWGRYFFKVQLIEKQEVKRQVLKKRAEQAKAESDTEINWDEDDLDVPEIPDAVQEKLLTDYEEELKKKPSHAKKDSNASDDWEKLSDDAK